MLDYVMQYGFWLAIILCTAVATFVGFLTGRRFFWRTFICVWPVLLAAWVAVVAVIKYDRGEAGGGFKLGVDLVGGTILVYEIDMRKVDKESRVDPQQQTALLAESLKRRIDPNDLYNIVIRPAKGEGRVEIILPTGGAHRVQKAEEDWAKLVTEMQQKYGLSKDERPDAPRGKIQELADQIHQRLAIKVWEHKLFNDQKDWKALLDNAENRWLTLKEDGKRQALAKVPVGKVQELVRVLQNELRGETSEREIDTWLKSRAWALMIDRALAKWPQLQQRKDKLAPDASDNFPIPPDNFEELVGRIQTEGDVIAQAALRAAQPLLGEDVLTPTNPNKAAKEKQYFISRQEAADFVKENYGPSRNAIEREIEQAYQATGYSRDLTSEEVQRIKDLVAKVGSLEFRILANGKDDKVAIEDNKNFINSNNPEVQKALQDAQEKGLPPPVFHTLGLKGPEKHYRIDLPNNNHSDVTYGWVELGKQERKTLHLDNAAATDQARNSEWALMARNRGKAMQLVLPGSLDNRPVLQGALFYSRECKDRNLPEEERRKKKFEYFVLTRNPEYVDGKQTPKIDGSYLVSAVSQMGNDARPVVAFTFNTTGGNLFGTLTRKNVPSGAGAEENQFRRHLAIILDGMIESAPTVNSEIRQHGQISGNFTQREVNQLVNTLRAGALPATLKPQPVSENTMGALLGKDTIDKGVNAVLYSFLAVLAFMILYYRFAGLVASVALLANLILTVGFMVAVQATFTLPGLAGLVLMLALAVDANVLIYERLREERDRGASLALAIRNGYDRAFPTIIDTHLSSIFTAIVLYVVGNDQLKGFGVSLTVGLIISLFTSLYMTRLMFDFWLSKGWLHKLSMARFFSKPDIDFMAIRYYWFTATILLTVAGMALFIGRLPNDLNIDFVGGTAYGGQLTKPYDIDGLRELVSEKRQDKMLSTAHARMVPGSDGRQFELWYDTNPGGSPKDVRTISLANKVEGDTPEDKEQAFLKRARELPDPSVEQYFVSSRGEEGESQPSAEDRNKTPYFNIRTTEKEPELVQAQLDRLLRVEEEGKGWVPLLKKIRMQADPAELAKTQKETHIRFSDPERGTPTYASPSFMKTLLVRELHKEFDLGDQTTLPFQVELTGEGKTDEQGRFQIMKLAFNPSLSQEQVKKALAALQRTEREFEDRPQPERLETFDSQLAADTRLRAMYAIVASWGAILLYLWFRFGSWTFGMATVLCLIHDLFFTLGIIAFCHYLHGTWLGDLLALQDFKIDLTSVAALLTLIGYSVSDTIVVFDRIREVRGKNPDLTPQMINDSVNQTLSRTLLTSFITWLVVFVLYVWGGPGVHLFAFVMVVGVVVGTYSSIYIASPLLLIFGEGTRARTRRELQPRPAPTSV
jgi:SecD/SecF fusion protein